MTTETGTGTGTPKRGKGALQIVALLAILYAAASVQMYIGTLIFIAALLVSALAIIRPIPSYGIPTRRYATAVFFSLLIGGSVAMGSVAGRHDEERLAALKTSDPDAYLAKLEKKGDQGRWLDELRILAPERYAVEKQKIDAAEAEKARQEATQAAIEAEIRAKEKEVAAAQKAREAKEKAQKEAHAREYGFHCLSTWDGSHPAIKDAVKSALRAPDSFEHVETSTFPVSAGRNKIIMTYRAQNGFGGTNVERAVGSFDNTTCDARVEMIE